MVTNYSTESKIPPFRRIAMIRVFLHRVIPMDCIQNFFGVDSSIMAAGFSISFDRVEDF